MSIHDGFVVAATGGERYLAGSQPEAGADVTTLIQSLPEGPLDIVGDVHGEIDALHRLLARLGADPVRGTVRRPLVFVGDLVDRGPDSPAVVELVMRLVQAGVAHMVLGNHEVNLLRRLRKEGNGWAYGEAADHHPVASNVGVHLVPFSSRLIDAAQREQFLSFFQGLPLVLQRADLRVVHAAWSDAALVSLQGHTDAGALATHTERAIEVKLRTDGVLEQEHEEFRRFAGLKRLDVVPDLLVAHPVAELARQMGNPVRVLTSGTERPVDGLPFYTGGKWRFLQRHDWWADYQDDAAVVVGHYWRRRNGAAVDGKPDAWATDADTDWAGARGNVFCVDYSVGRRFLERYHGRTKFHGGLAAMRWPERTLVFDDRDEVLPTTRFGHAAGSSRAD